MSRMEFFTLKSEADGLDLAMLSVTPDGDPVGMVQFSHGMCEHKERYLPFMEYLAGHGLFCVINDHRGHGGSVKSKDDLGYMYAGGDTALVDDLHQITRWMRGRFPGKKLVLFGHSMGSLAVRAYCDAYDRDIDALIVCGSPGENPSVGVGTALVRLLTALKGERYVSNLVKGLTVGGFEKRFAAEGRPGSWLSRNVENVQRYAEDPLCGFDFTLNANLALMHLLRRAYSIDPKHTRRDLPVRFYSGADDPCAPDKAGFDNAVQKMRAAGYTDVKGHMFPGLRHEILNEAEHDAVFERIWSEAIEPFI